MSCINDPGWYDIKDNKRTKLIWGRILAWWLLTTPLASMFGAFVLMAVLKQVQAGIIMGIWMGYTAICLTFIFTLARKNRPVSIYLDDLGRKLKQRGKEKEEVCKRKVAALGDAYKYHNNYAGKAKTYAMLNPLHYIPLLILLAMIITFFFAIGSLATIVVIVPAIYLGIAIVILYRLLTRRITIGLDGVSLRYGRETASLSWSEVQTIGITIKNEAGKPSTTLGYVFISRRKIDKDLICLPNSIGHLMKKGHVFFKFRPKLMHHLLAYWHGEVQGLERIPAWRRYVRRYNQKYE